MDTSFRRRRKNPRVWIQTWLITYSWISPPTFFMFLNSNIGDQQFPLFFLLIIGRETSGWEKLKPTLRCKFVILRTPQLRKILRLEYEYLKFWMCVPCPFHELVLCNLNLRPFNQRRNQLLVEPIILMKLNVQIHQHFVC